LIFNKQNSSESGPFGKYSDRLKFARFQTLFFTSKSSIIFTSPLTIVAFFLEEPKVNYSFPIKNNDLEKLKLYCRYLKD